MVRLINIDTLKYVNWKAMDLRHMLWFSHNEILSDLHITLPAQIMQNDKSTRIQHFIVFSAKKLFLIVNWL